MEQILMAALAGLAYGLTHAAKKVQAGQEFDIWKLLATEIVAVVVAVSLVLSGAKVDEMTFEQQFVLYGFLIPIVENTLKAIYRLIKNRVEQHYYRPRSGGLPRKYRR